LSENDTLEELKLFTITHDLPKTDLALFGTRCPYCGKTDRIRPLESPVELSAVIHSEDLTTYEGFWNALVDSDGSIGVCKFCQNPLRIGKDGQAVPFTQIE
jgi:hypothetical protein